MAFTTSFGKKAAAAALAVLTLGAGLTATTGAAEARGGRKGAAIAAGLIGAVAAGALIAGAANAHAAPAYNGYYAPVDDGYAPSPVYYGGQGYYGQGYYGQGYYGHRHHRYRGYSETGFSYAGPVCKIRKERVWDGYGWVVQRTRICR